MRADRKGSVTIDPSLPADVKAIAPIEGEIRLRSGQTSSTYFDKYRVEADPALLKLIADRLCPELSFAVDGGNVVVWSGPAGTTAA